ncbi:MAG: TonB-dependent receptor domain-containing protein [Chitinophagales bacterium]
MPACCQRLLIVFGLCVLFSRVEGQDSAHITGDFQQLSFHEFVHQIESQCDYRFFYDSADLDSLVVNLRANHLLVNILLERVLHGSGFHYAIDSLHYVVISRDIIRDKLASNFFKRTGTAADTLESEPDSLAELTENKGLLQSSIENKLFVIGFKANRSPNGKATLAGYVRDIKNGEPVIGASVYLDSASIGVNTDQFGYYSLTLPQGRHTLHISNAGMKDTKREIELYSDGKLNVELQDFVASLKMVTVVSEKNSNTRRVQMGVEKLNIKSIKQVAVVFGETDILKVVLTLPGVTSVGEASTGFNVRGGSTDQNLIQFNGSTIYNPTHLFGFFSSFNSDVIKEVELYKSSIPEKYGGRLSSVLDVTTRDGNNKKWSGTGGLGLLTARMTVEGPIVKDKTSFILGGRASYSDWLLKFLPSRYQNSSASFYDLDLHVNHTINAKNNLYLTGYYSSDQFRLTSDTLYKYSNANVNLKWKHVFNNKFYAVVTVGQDHYQYSNSSDQNKVSAYKLSFDINQTNFRADFSYSLSYKHTLDFGLTSEYYLLHPGSLQPIGKESLVTSNDVPAERGLESAIYLGDNYRITPKLSANIGLRYSIYNYIGPHDVYTYAPGVPRQTSTIIDTVSYGSGKFIKTYQGPEFRIALRYSVGENSSVKFAYNTMRQYIHMLSNTTTISPTDIWKLSDPYILPQVGDQISLGYYQNFKSNTIETSIEVYYKRQQHVLDYKSGAVLVLNHHIETDVFNTRGKAYGIEFLIKKEAGKLNGWLSYTYSRTLLQQDDPLAGETINKGQYYPANYDKPNLLNLIGNYRFSHRYSVSLNVIYSTGRPVTLPIASFYYDGGQRVYYSDRNQYRIPDYFRMDLSINIDGNHKVKQLTHNYWSIGVYNLTGRQNAYSVYFVEENGVMKGYKLSIFDTPIPFITYNFRF